MTCDTQVRRYQKRQKSWLNFFGHYFYGRDKYENNKFNEARATEWSDVIHLPVLILNCRILGIPTKNAARLLRNPSSYLNAWPLYQSALYSLGIRIFFDHFQNEEIFFTYKVKQTYLKYMGKSGNLRQLLFVDQKNQVVMTANIPDHVYCLLWQMCVCWQTLFHEQKRGISYSAALSFAVVKQGS